MKKKNFILCVGLLFSSLLSACNPDVVQGPKGDQGEPGINGVDGRDGVDGKDGDTPYIGENGNWWIGTTDTGVKADAKDGTKTYTGNGDPSTDIGVAGEIYINTSNGEVYLKSQDGVWIYIGCIQTYRGKSVISAYIDENGHIYVRMSDGSESFVGTVMDHFYGITSEVEKFKVEFYFKDVLVETQEVESGGKATPPYLNDYAENRGYLIDYWFVWENSYRSPWSFSGCTVTSDVELHAFLEGLEYAMWFDSNGGEEINEPIFIRTDEEIHLPTPVREGYNFDFWALSSTPDVAFTSTVFNLAYDPHFIAHWTAALQELKVTSSDDTKGSVSIASGSGYTDESITVEATPKDGCVFIGWYSGDSLISPSSTYTFTMPSKAYELTAKFVTEEEVNKLIALGAYPSVNFTNNTITYGLYPQSRVSDSTLLTSLNALTSDSVGINGWYLYNDQYYAKVSATPWPMSSDKCVFDDGTVIKKGTTYWFKCEPITWNIIKTNEDEYSLASNVILDSHNYHSSTEERTIDGQTIYSVNYEHSDIRSWLINSFYNTAFNLNDDFLQTVIVDNGTNLNPSSGANTSDRVYLMGKNDSGKGVCKTSEYSRAKGVFPNDKEDYKYCGTYWLRGTDRDSTMALSISDSGGNGWWTVTIERGVRPAITIKL